MAGMTSTSTAHRHQHQHQHSHPQKTTSPSSGTWKSQSRARSRPAACASTVTALVRRVRRTSSAYTRATRAQDSHVHTTQSIYQACGLVARHTLEVPYLSGGGARARLGNDGFHCEPTSTSWVGGLTCTQHAHPMQYTHAYTCAYTHAYTHVHTQHTRMALETKTGRRCARTLAMSGFMETHTLPVRRP